MSAIICSKCSAQFDADRLDDTVTACPECGARVLPMSEDNFVNIRINIHELRVLGIWAENYASIKDHENLDNPNHEDMRELIDAITNRIRKQLPDPSMPLTLFQEFEQLRETFPKFEITLIRNGVEEI